MVQAKLTSYDSGYQSGDLSLYPFAIDSFNNLYEATNMAQAKLSQSLNYGSQTIIVDDTSSFPEKGILRLHLADKKDFPAELVYYYKKTRNTFQELIRGFCNTRQAIWPINTAVDAGVMAEHHNSVKDAVLQVENYLGTTDETSELTLNGILKKQEARFFSPKPIFRAFPTRGAAPHTVTFHDFSTSITSRYFWDFGDGGTSIEKNPTHVYLNEGVYTVQLRIITSLGAQGFATKTNYIQVSNDFVTPFFYTTPLTGYSKDYAQAHAIQPTTFTFVDQTQGEILNRLWQYDDGTSDFITDPNVHTTTHQFQSKGIYFASLLLTLAGQKTFRTILTEPITVL
jgi:PKD repeat protein